MAKKFGIDATVKFFVVVIGISVIAMVLRELSHIFIPFVIAYILFFFFSPANDFLRKKHFPLFAVILIDLLFISIIFWIASSFVIGSFLKFGDQAPDYFTKLNKVVTNTASSLHIKAPFFRYFSIQRLISRIDYQGLAGGIFSSTFSIIGNILFILFFYIFIVTGHTTTYNAIKNRFVYKRVKPGLKEMERKYRTSQAVPNPDFDQWMGDQLNIEKHEQEEKLANTFRAITEQIQRYIILKIALNLSAGIIVWIFMSILGVDFPIIWGLFTFIFNFIPTIGSAIALIFPVTMALLQFGSLTYALLIALILAAIQTLFFNLLEPNLIGKKLNLNPLLILMAVLIWGYIWGIIGMLLAVPLTAIIKIIITNSDSKNMIFLGDLMSKE